jgi:hypothetical protein
MSAYLRWKTQSSVCWAGQGACITWVRVNPEAAGASTGGIQSNMRDTSFHIHINNSCRSSFQTPSHLLPHLLLSPTSYTDLTVAFPSYRTISIQYLSRNVSPPLSSMQVLVRQANLTASFVSFSTSTFLSHSHSHSQVLDSTKTHNQLLLWFYFILDLSLSLSSVFPAQEGLPSSSQPRKASGT